MKSSENGGVQYKVKSPIYTDVRRLAVICVFIQSMAFLSIAPLWLFGFLAVFVAGTFVPFISRSRVLRGALLLTGVFAFFAHYKLAYSVEMASVFLLLVVSMKIYELSTKRDALVFSYAMLYLSAVSMLFEQSIFHAALQICSVLCCFGLLMRVNNSVIGSVRSHILSVLKVLSFALPFAIVLFVFFPRISPLWSLPFKTSSSLTGMSDSMAPGAVAELSQSAERAFRFSVVGSAPAHQQLYWRALVLDDFDGRSWTRSKEALDVERLRAGVLYANRVEPYVPITDTGPYYDVIAEPHNNRWAFALSGSSPGSSNVHGVGSGIVEFAQDISAPMPYRMKATVVAETEALAPGITPIRDVARVASQGAQDLLLPKTGNPKARRLVDGWLAQGPTELELVLAVQQYFGSQGFVYTLKPPSLGADSVDEFLFETRRGFCEHYASAMAFILREAGMRARVVLGYLGGEYNSSLDYWVVRQYDAHAWVEVHVSGLGWLRVDPTAVVAPDRILDGLERAVSAEGSFLSDSALARLAYSMSGLRWMRDQLDAVNYRWQKFVLGYDGGAQRAFLSDMLGALSLRAILWWLVGSLSVVTVMVATYFWLGRYRPELGRAERKYLRFLLLLQLFKVKRAQGETPLAFYARVQSTLPSALRTRLEKRTDALYKTLYNVAR